MYVVCAPIDFLPWRDRLRPPCRQLLKNVIQFPIDHSQPFPDFFSGVGRIWSTNTRICLNKSFQFSLFFFPLKYVGPIFVIFFADRPKRPSSSSIFRLAQTHSLMSFHLVGRPVLMMFLGARELCVCLCFRWRILSTTSTSKSENTPKIGRKFKKKEKKGKHLLFSLHILERRGQKRQMGSKGSA